MFVLDNELVRTGWSKAKSVVSDLIAKHGGTTHTSRRWAERKLAYPIRGRERGTYLLTHYEIPAGEIPKLIRDLDLAESVLRYLLLAVDSIPDGEAQLTEAEHADDFSVDAPPADDAGTYAPLQTEGTEEEAAEAPAEKPAEGEKAEADEKEADEEPKAEAETPAETTTRAESGAAEETPAAVGGETDKQEG